MLDPVRSGRFKRDVKLAAKRGKDLGKLRDLLTLLIEEKPLPERYRDHPLKGVGWVTVTPTWNRIGC
jgi:mRNA interferase YafQ